MIVCTGKATKRIEEFQYHTKEYVATIRLGDVYKRQFKGLFKWQMNEETRYVINILVSMIPIGIVEMCIRDSLRVILEFLNPFRGLARTDYHHPRSKRVDVYKRQA